MNFKKILLSLSLCLILLTGSVFATNMTKSDIVDYFDDNVSSDITVNSYVVGNFSDILDGIDSYISDFPDQFESDYTLSNNYFCYYYNDDENYYDYYDLGNSKIISCDYSNYTFTLYLDNGAKEFKGYSEESTCFQTLSVNNIQVPINLPLPSDDFDDLFIFNSDNIFWSDSSSGDNTLLQDLADSVSAVLSYIPVVITGLWQIVLIQFIILAGLSISIIYFVIKLFKSFTGNKLNNKRFKK